jgi:hypothetical protein
MEMSQDDIDAANLRFRLIDADNSGYIDWDEYLNYECMRKLHRTQAVIYFNKKMLHYLSYFNFFGGNLERTGA